MKKILLLCAFCVSVAMSSAQKETFDLTTYTVPKGWKKQPAESAIQFSKEDAAKGTYCLITLYKAVPGTANAKENFDLAWTSLVKEMVTVTNAPEMQPAVTEDGWDVHSGYAPFERDGNKGVVVLVTSSGFDKMVNLIILTNTDVYEKEMSSFLESVSLKKPETNAQSTPAVNDDKNSIIGTWGISVVVPYRSGTEGSAGSNVRQYTFNANGTYTFYIKTFSYSVTKLFLTRESGTYQISGNNITINPQKSVIEAWSKKDGTSKWGKLLSTQNKTLEKTTYQFTKHYFSGVQEWNLVLQANNQTQRDGPYSNNTTFNKAWLYGTPCSECLIQLPEGKQITTEEKKSEPAQQPSTTSASNIALVGTWGKGNSVGQAGGSYGRWSYTKEQYIFNNNGTYSFVRKVYREDDMETFLTRETGTFSVNGNKITLSPSINVIEAWSKKNGGDNFNQLRSQQKKPLEKTIYQFSVEYEPDLKQTSLLLIATATERDGAFNATINSNNGWRYGPTPPYTPIKMPN